MVEGARDGTADDQQAITKEQQATLARPDQAITDSDKELELWCLESLDHSDYSIRLRQGCSHLRTMR
jgi:hypothetical protein